MSEARLILNEQLSKLVREKGLKGISLYPEHDEHAHPDDYYREISRMLDAIDRNEGKPLKFNDSRKK